MFTQYFTMESIPDFTMAKYSTLENGNVDDIVKQHLSFYRQLHRRGMLFEERYTLLYWYDPDRPAGKKIRMLFRIECASEIHRMYEFLKSTALSSSFQIEPCSMEKAEEVVFPYRSILLKKYGQIASASTVNESSYFVVDNWKENDKGRLIGVFRLMKALDENCVYSVRICPVDKSEEYRNALQKQIKWMKPPAGIGLGIQQQRDENAEKCIKLYHDSIDKLRSNPHFVCEISAYAENEASAKLLLDSAAAEAVEEGNYLILCNQKQVAFTPLVPEARYIPRIQGCPEGMELWPALFLLKELAPFSTFPTLYAGESIEIPKETAPIYEADGLSLGKDQQGYQVYVPFDLLTKHALLAGVPGSGKTFTMLHIASQLANHANQIPILVLEPAKQEYRALVQNPDVYDLTVFAPGGGGAFPLRINPFEFPKGMKLSEHIVNLRQVFIGAFDLEPPMPFLLDQGIENVYRACGWYPFDYNVFNEKNENIKPYPNMQMLFDEVGNLLEASDYAEEVRNNLKSVLQVRIGSLVSRETGNVFNVPKSTFMPEEWLEHSCVIELESLGKDASNFLTLLLATVIRELLKQNPKAEKSPRHVIFFEEAHNLIGPYTEANQASGNAKVASTKFIVDMLAEVRALKEAIIIADQLPTALAPQVTKNTALKIALKVTAQDDREMLASTMSADGVQLEQMALFNPGHALCIYGKVQKPFEVQIDSYKGLSDPPDNDRLYELQSRNGTYMECMKRDFHIMLERFETKEEDIHRDWLSILSIDKELDESKRAIFRLTDVNAKKEKILSYRAAMGDNFRRKKNLFQRHLELLLEFGDYVFVNKYMQTLGKDVLNQKQTFFFDCVNAANEWEKEEAYSLNHDIESAFFELAAMWNKINV